MICLHERYEIIEEEKVGSCVYHDFYGDEIVITYFDSLCVCCDCGYTFNIDREVESYE